MVRGYYGWQRANVVEEGWYKRELAKRTAELRSQQLELGDPDYGSAKIDLPWVKT